MADAYKGMTAYFEYDLSELDANPHFIETQFGKARVVSRGNEFAERDALEAQRDELLEALKAIRDHSGDVTGAAAMVSIAREAIAKAEGQSHE